MVYSELASNDIGDPYFVRNTAGHEQRVNIISHPQSHSAHARGYETYIQDGISFIIQPGIITREPSNSNRASIDHLEAGYRVPLDEILGIMVPEDALGMKISDLPLGFRNMRTRSILSRLRAIIEYLRVKHHYEVPEGDELMDMLADPAIDETVTDSDEGAVTRLRLEHLIAKHIEIAFARTFDMSTGQLTLRIVVHRLARAANKCLAYNDIEYVAREESEHEDSEDDYSDWGEEEEDQGFFSRL